MSPNVSRQIYFGFISAFVSFAEFEDQLKQVVVLFYFIRNRSNNFFDRRDFAKL